VIFLERERAVLESLLPGLDKRLAEVPFERLESKDGPAIDLFRDAGGPGLLVPREVGGLGATPVDAISVQRALGSRCPSLAVATTMHHFSVASLVAVARLGEGFEPRLLEEIAIGRKLLASGFAEGVHAQGVFSPTMRARRNGDGLLVSGEKKPCSLSRSMDLLTASVVIESDGSGDEEFAVAVIPAGAPGITVTPFWGASVLAGTQSDAVVLTNVAVDPGMVVRSRDGSTADFGGTQVSSCIWFELLITASYLGIASTLAERLLEAQTGDLAQQAAAVIELEAAMASLDSVARRVMDGQSALLPTTLACRYACQDAITRAVAITVEQLGGMAFVSSGEVGYLAAASHALAFHPPPRTRTAPALAEAFKAGEFAFAPA
jgi:alkylation response protein AidB-like acyl-CoA dehydrogenase